MKQKDKDFLRWAIYSIILFGLAIGTMANPALVWVWTLAFAISLSDLLYVQYSRYLG